jgi:hypothetical protein
VAVTINNMSLIVNAAMQRAWAATERKKTERKQADRKKAERKQAKRKKDERKQAERKQAERKQAERAEGPTDVLNLKATDSDSAMDDIVESATTLYFMRYEA